MHISEGVLSAPVLIGGGALSAGCVAYGLKKMEYKKIPQVAVLSSAFFVGSLIHIPAGPVSVHLVLNGINGLILGWAAFPSILVALTLQAVLFQFGGITTLGVNTFNMAFPAVLSYYMFNRLARSPNMNIAMAAGFGAGSFSVAAGGAFIALSLVATGEEFAAAAKIVLAAHLPVMIIEGLFTAACVAFLRKVRPEILEAHV